MNKILGVVGEASEKHSFLISVFVDCRLLLHCALGKWEKEMEMQLFLSSEDCGIIGATLSD